MKSIKTAYRPIKKPEKTEEVAIFKQGFDYLITHLENEPNPFIKENK